MSDPGIPRERTPADRRHDLIEQSPRGLILIRGAGPEGANPNFVYLTGIHEPNAALLLAPDGVRVETGRLHPGPDYVRGRIAHQVLFLPSPDPMASRWGEAAAATVGSISAEQAGVDAILPNAELGAALTTALANGERLEYVRAWSPNVDGADDPDTVFLATIRRRFTHLTLGDATPRVHEMRRLKDAGEVAAIERAVEVTAESLQRVVRRLRAGIQEYEIEAEIASVYRAHGATHAFDPIVGCGDNALALHYTENSGPVEDGRLLLVDTGASLHGYKSDITRTYPVGGTYTDRQREVYETVLRAQQAVIAKCRPGALLGDLHAEAYDVIESAGLGDRFVHGLGHHLGLETHDVGDAHRPLEPGAVITVEPGAYLSDEGIGVRIEDDVLITETGCRVLSDAIPSGVEAIEELLRGGGA